VDAADRAIVSALAPLLSRHRIALAGVDVIGGLLIEVNVTCPGGMAKADALLGTDLSDDVMRRLLGVAATDLLSQREERVPA
jgi:glutathione synthase